MKNDVKSTADWQKLVTEKDCEIVRLQQQIEWLTQQFRLMQAERFASSSEKTIAIVDQLSLFNRPVPKYKKT